MPTPAAGSPCWFLAWRSRSRVLLTGVLGAILPAAGLPAAGLPAGLREAGGGRHVRVGPAMLDARAPPEQGRRVLRGDVALVLREAVLGMRLGERDHEAITGHLRHHGCRGDTGRDPIALPHR